MIDEATGYKLCKHGHVRSPENVDKHYACRICKRVLRNTDDYKSYQKTYMENYRKSTVYLDYVKARQKTDEYKAYRKSDVQKAYMKNFQESIQNSYVALKLNMPVSQCTPELIEIKRLTIQLKRSIKCQLNQKKP